MSELKSTHEVEGLDHVGLNVPDLNQAIAFFTDAFGATTIFRLDRISDPEGESMERLGAHREAAFELAMLQLGSGRLELLRWWSPDSSEYQPKSSAVGASHLAIRVANVAGTLKDLRRRDDVRILGEPVTFETGATPGLTNAFLTAPWGALIELVNWGDTK